MDHINRQKSEQVKKRLNPTGTGNNEKAPKMMYHYLFNLLCFQFRVLPIPYFMDECSMYEIDDILDYIPYTDRNMWEQARLQAYIDAKSHFKGIKSISDICEFKWEKNEEDEEHIIEISDSEINDLKNLSRQWEN